MRTKAKAEAAKAVSLNHEQGLYVIPSTHGYSCLGFDVLERRYNGLAAELKALGVEIPPPEPRATLVRHEQYRKLVEKASELNQKNGWRSKSELTPELIGLEGKRVEVRHTWESGQVERSRFIVGKSTGFIPCHLEIKTRRSTGGGAVCLGKILSVCVVS